MNLSANKDDSKKTKKALKNLQGYQVETTLDRQLLLGIFDETKIVSQPNEASADKSMAPP